MSRAALILTALCGAALCASERPEAAQNVIVHKEAGRFAGWPANNGIWSWGNEIVVGFKLGYLKPNEHGHAIDPAKPSSLRFARSLDGGRTWKTEMPSFNDDADVEKTEFPECPGGLDFTNPNSAVAIRMVSDRRVGRQSAQPDQAERWPPGHHVRLPLRALRHSRTPEQ